MWRNRKTEFTEQMFSCFRRQGVFDPLGQERPREPFDSRETSTRTLNSANDIAILCAYSGDSPRVCKGSDEMDAERQEADDEKLDVHAPPFGVGKCPSLAVGFVG